MSLLTLDKLTLRRGLCPVLDAVSFAIAPGDCVGLIGPNGAGKTTLLRAALGLLPHEGRSTLADMPRHARARHAAWLPQDRVIAWPLPVEEVVALGRLPHGRTATDTDRAAIDSAMTRMGLDGFRGRPATELSGGETARVLVARALAQDTPLLLADEPIAGLDPAAQLAPLETFRGLASAGRGVLLSSHDLTLAARYCTRLVLLNAGRVQAQGHPAEVLTPQRLAEVFHVSAKLHATDNGPLVEVLERLP